MTRTLELDGHNLGAVRLVRLARDFGSRITLSEKGLGRMVQANALVHRALADGSAVYGLTTGLGARAGERTAGGDNAQHQAIRFSCQTLRGRAHSLGEPLSAELVRGAMLVRMNTFLLGGSGASTAAAQQLKDFFNAGLTPQIGSIASIGASDLCMGATLGAALIGEGKVSSPRGIVSAKEAMQRENLQPLQLDVRDGLALANHSGFSASFAAFAFYDALALFNAAQSAAAFCSHAFAANPSPLHFAAISELHWEADAARQLLDLLDGIGDGYAYRNVQDPLSFRNLPQIHGATGRALSWLRESVNAALNTPSDNPLIDLQTGRIASSGAYFPAHLESALSALMVALEQQAVAQVCRISRLLSSRHSDLPPFLARENAHSNGFAPAMKLAEALLATLKHSLKPLDHWPSQNADGIEDLVCHAPLLARSLLDALPPLLQLTALEFMVAAQAIELRGEADRLSATPNRVYSTIRRHIARLDEDRGVSEDIETLEKVIRCGALSPVNIRGNSGGS